LSWLREKRTHSSAGWVPFTTAPEWSISFQWVLGLLSGGKETTAVAFTRFSNPGSLERRKEKNLPLRKNLKTLPKKRLQIHTTSYTFILLLTHRQFLSFFIKKTKALSGSAPSFTCFIISSDEGRSQNSAREPPVSRLSPRIHLLTEPLNEPRGRNANQRI